MNCVDCGKKVETERDIEMCDKCMNAYNLMRLWEDHDNNLIDALDFNERASFRQIYKK